MVVSRRSGTPRPVVDAFPPDTFELHIPDRTPTFHSPSLGVSSPLQVFTGTALRRATLRSTRRQIPAAALARTATVTPTGMGATSTAKTTTTKTTSTSTATHGAAKAGETWKNFKPVEKRELGDRLAEVLDVIRNAKYESISRNQGRDDLAMRLCAAEQENEKLTEEVKKQQAINDKAAHELLKDAEELAFMSMRLENLEGRPRLSRTSTSSLSRLQTSSQSWSATTTGIHHRHPPGP